MKNKTACLVAILLVATAALAGASEIQGRYIEARNAEVYASHCFANSELGISGDLAVMAWQVDRGAHNGVPLDGLSVVAVIRASSTSVRTTSLSRSLLALLANDASASCCCSEARSSKISTDFTG